MSHNQKSKSWEKKCLNITKEFYSLPLARIFTISADPLNPYFIFCQKISKYLDLTVIKHSLETHKYKNEIDWADDFELVFQNAITFYDLPTNSTPIISIMAKYLLKKFRTKRKILERNSYNDKKLKSLYIKYIDILSNLPKNIHNTEPLPKLKDLSGNLEENSLIFLESKLNKISSNLDFNKICEILSINPINNLIEIELAELSKEKISSLWDYINLIEKK